MTKLASVFEVLAVILLKTFSVALSILLIGDFLSTFLYHVPEHVFGKFHSIVHHGKNRSFIHYAVLTKNPLVLIDGFLGALPYFVFLPFSWQISPIGSLLGIILGELHVIWRHVSIINWQTPKAIAIACKLLFITTPEQHWLHHQDANLAYGDIFTFYDRPARVWMKFLLTIKRKYYRHSKISKA
ncbi:sterol desaturase family protein [Myxosarcina sp. GI1]|uniref:sterol desaturase family protein n=1 Tax=Myxosarcina sp. GI1 TaxID=1541065 RepID=UPI00209E006E|nr:sterol desaturase family protein [Myxosarcina sp. GI1]